MRVWDFLIISGGFFSVVMMLGYLVSKTKTPIHRVMVGIFLCHAVIVINKGIACSGIILQYPFTLHWDLFTYYLISPLIYLYLRMFIDSDFSFKMTHLWLFLPCLVVITLYIPFFMKPAPERIALYPYYIKIPPGPLRVVIVCSYFCPSLMIFFYTAMGLRQYAVAPSLTYLTRTWAARFILILCIEIIVLAGMMIAAWFFWSYDFYRVIFLCLNQVVICFFLINQRYPDLYDHLKEEVRKTRVTNTHLAGLEIPRLILQIEQLLGSEKLYKDAELTLAALSRKLKISPHQLSEILNKRMLTSFKTLINTHRLNAAEEMLLDAPERNILDIAFESGFKSKSAFNSFFMREKGMTPTDFRKKYLQEKKP